MRTLFFYGTLRDDALMRIVLGEEAARAARPARLAGHGIFWAEGQIFPTIEAAEGHLAEGLLIEGLDDAALARLDFYEGGFGYDLRPVEVTAKGAAMPAEVYFPRPGLWTRGLPWDLADWQARFGALSRTAAREAMGYLGRFTVDELASRMPMIRARAASRLAATPKPAAQRWDMGADAVEDLSCEVPHAAFYKVEVRRLKYPRFDGAMGDEVRREVFVATDAALVLPYDPVRDRVLLVEQFRMGPYGRGDPRPWMLEPVAGRVDPGETPEDAARRECSEEAGLSLRRLERIGSYYCTPGYSTEYFHNFVGLCDLPDDLPRRGGLEAEHEDLRLHLLDLDDAMDLIETGEADNGPLILSLLWLARARTRLRAVG